MAPITHQVVNNGTQKNQSQFVDSLGHTYTPKCTGPDGTIWVCSVRSKTVTCNATVIQCGDKFTAGPDPHCHPRRPNRQVKRPTSDVGEGTNKSEAPVLGRRKVRKLDQADESETSEMEGSLQNEEMQDEDSILGCRVDQFWLGRRKNSQADITSFQLEKEFIPDGFLRADVQMKDAKHILLFTDTQKALLECAKTLYLDKTLKVVQMPFEQIFSIHAFVEESGSEDSECCYVPLAFCLMSRRRKTDYLEVLKELIKAVPSMSEDVQAVVMDFEVPVWQAMRELFGKKAVLRGCIYHWSKAVWGKCLELQLRVHYESNRYVAEVINWLMALPYLPEKHIEEAFLELQRMASLKPSLTRLFQYFETTWILGFWTPKDWSVYLNPLRSEEEAEGWIKQLSSKAGCSSLPYHELIILLHEESQAVGGHLRIAKKKKVITEQRKARAQIESLFVKWEKYKKGHLSVSLLLSACSRLKGSVG